GLFALAAPTLAGWSGPQLASTRNLSAPSMVATTGGRQEVVARGDTGIWYVTDETGTMVRTRLTQDFDTHANGHILSHMAMHPVIAINKYGALTVVYSANVERDGTAGSCDSQGLRYIVRTQGSWSSPLDIPGTSCEEATGVVVRGAKIAIATIHVAG